MRKFLVSLLVAGAVTTPAFADAVDRHSHDGSRVERSESRSNHQDRSSDRSQARSENRTQVTADRPQRNADRQQRPNGLANWVNRDRAAAQGNVEVQQQQAAVEARGRAYGRANAADIEHIRAAREAQQGRSAEYRNMRERQHVSGGGFVQPDRDVPNVMRSHNRTPVVSDVPRQGTQPPLRADGRRVTHNNWSSNWNRNWRNDNRYDWHNYRHQHRSRFHLSLYSDPFGWGYQPYSVGWRLWPNYYSSNYWINDPWQYRLPYAPPGTQWVRYYNDALLVDMYTGQVVDVLYNFFW